MEDESANTYNDEYIRMSNKITTNKYISGILGCCTFLFVAFCVSLLFYLDMYFKNSKCATYNNFWCYSDWKCAVKGTPISDTDSNFISPCFSQDFATTGSGLMNCLVGPETSTLVNSCQNVVPDSEQPGGGYLMCNCAITNADNCLSNCPNSIDNTDNKCCSNKSNNTNCCTNSTLSQPQCQNWNQN